MVYFKGMFGFCVGSSVGCFWDLCGWYDEGGG